MIWWPVLFIVSVFAQDNSFERYCYSSASEMRSSHVKAKAIFVPSDQVSEDGNCLVIQMRPHRRELIQSYLRNINPNVSISFSSADIRREPCKLKVEKVSEVTLKKTTGGIDEFGAAVSTQETKSNNLETMQITTLNDFELMVNYESIKGVCRYITATRYEISLEVKKDPKPLLPPTSPGTIVVVNSKELPPPQSTSKLQTTLQLNQGDRIEIGSIVKDLREKSGSINLPVEAQGTNQDGANLEKVFLTLD